MYASVASGVVARVLIVAVALLCIAAPALAEEYKLGAGDTVRVAVYNNPDLATEARIGDDGAIPFPLIGRVEIGGLTKAAAEQRLSQLLTERGFLREAAINITVTEYRSQQVSVLGAVTRPGKYPISSATTVLDILAEAGGIAANGSSSIRLVQRDAAGKAVQREIDVKRLVGSTGDSVDLAVRHGDVIFVAQQPVFYIYGEVQKPGAYPLHESMTVRQAIAMGGGLTIRGTERGLRVSRRNDAGVVEVYRAKLSDRLIADDVVQVKESLF
jgi:polysaccharide export outer membrane protein